MKTTIQIADSLFEEAREIARQKHTTLRALVEEGLRCLIVERKKVGKFHLRKATFKGTGLHPDVEGASWEQIRKMAYEGRGG